MAFDHVANCRLPPCSSARVKVASLETTRNLSLIEMGAPTNGTAVPLSCDKNSKELTP